MGRKIILPIIAFLGIGFGIFMIYFGKREPPVPPIAFPPPSSPYVNFVAGAGILEAASENIKIGTPFPDLVTDIYVSAGDKVKKDTPLFKIDTRKLEANLQESEKFRNKTLAKLEEDQIRFSYYERLKDKRAVSDDAYTVSYFNLKIAEKAAEEAQAAVDVIITDLERSIILAPMDGEVLQVNVKKGQFANVNPFDKKPLILFGNTEVFHIRVDIDEEDSWRVEKNAPATAFVRGNSSYKIPLEFVKIEPYIIPKTSLTGDNTERVDTRVLQVIYRFQKGTFPVYIGQLMDVYIKTPLVKREPS